MVTPTTEVEVSRVPGGVTQDVPGPPPSPHVRRRPPPRSPGCLFPEGQSGSEAKGAPWPAPPFGRAKTVAAAAAGPPASPGLLSGPFL